MIDNFLNKYFVYDDVIYRVLELRAIKNNFYVLISYDDSLNSGEIIYANISTKFFDTYEEAIDCLID